MSVSQPAAPAEDSELLALKRISDGHPTFCSVVSDRLHCLTSITQVLFDGDFKVLTVAFFFRSTSI